MRSSPESGLLAILHEEKNRPCLSKNLSSRTMLQNPGRTSVAEESRLLPQMIVSEYASASDARTSGAHGCVQYHQE